jgi:hypothetical protein
MEFTREIDHPKNSVAAFEKRGQFKEKDTLLLGTFERKLSKFT